MRSSTTAIADVLVLEPEVVHDARGFFMECFNTRSFYAATGVHASFVQDNHSQSHKGVLRGLHYQTPHAQGKLVWTVQGTVFDVVVDIRRNSPSFGHWFGIELSAANQRQLWIPAGLAHGFLVLSKQADVFYKTTDYCYPEHEHCLLWNDPDLAIDWPDTGVAPLLSERDQQGRILKEVVLTE